MQEFICPFCENPVDPTSPKNWHRVRGWERHAGVRPSGKHGGSDIALREPEEEFAHAACIRMAKSGLTIRQESLL